MKLRLLATAGVTAMHPSHFRDPRGAPCSHIELPTMIRASFFHHATVKALQWRVTVTVETFLEVSLAGERQRQAPLAALAVRLVFRSLCKLARVMATQGLVMLRSTRQHLEGIARTGEAKLARNDHWRTAGSLHTSSTACS